MMPAGTVTQHRQNWAGFEGRHDEAKYPGPASLSDLVNSQIENFIRHTHTHPSCAAPTAAELHF